MDIDLLSDSRDVEKVIVSRTLHWVEEYIRKTHIPQGKIRGYHQIFVHNNKLFNYFLINQFIKSFPWTHQKKMVGRNSWSRIIMSTIVLRSLVIFICLLQNTWNLCSNSDSCIDLFFSQLKNYNDWLNSYIYAHETL